MFKVSALALVVALCNAEASRRLLQNPPVDPAAPVDPIPAEPAVVDPTTIIVDPAAPAVPAEPAAPVDPIPAEPLPVDPLPPVVEPLPPVVEPATPATPAQPTVPVQPTVPTQPVPVQPTRPVQPQPRPQPQPQRPYNPYCDFYSGMYDPQDCMQYSFMYGGNPYAPQQPAYNPYATQPSYNPYAGQNMNNPYCNPMSPAYDIQDCMQFGYMNQYRAQPAAPTYNPYGQQPQQYNPYAQQPQAPAAPATPGYPQQRPGAVNPMNNPYCNPYSGMYDAQDCFRSSNGLWHMI